MTLPPILLVGEAWGEQEEKLGEAFVGPTGAELLKQLKQIGAISFDSRDQTLLNQYFAFNNPVHLSEIWHRHSAEVRRTNVFNLRPPRNDLSYFCGPKPDAIAGYPKHIDGYIRAEFEPELDRLANDVLSINPNLIVCLGNTSLWALGGRVGIAKWRGATLASTHTVTDYKLLPTYHPSGVLHQYSLRVTALHDLAKAKREAEFPDVRHTQREIWIEPSTDDVATFFATYLLPDIPLSVDIETSGTRITCIGFGYSHLAIVIPFDDERSKNGSYWATDDIERSVWRIIDSVLSDRSIPKVFHNGLYDIAFLWRSMKIKVRGALHDTMLLSHSLQPESWNGKTGTKKLAFCGSIWANECAWKNLGAHHKTIKRDD